MIINLKSPILVLGAGGFVGSNLFHKLRAVRSDVFGTYRASYSRLNMLDNTIQADLMHHARAIFEYVKPRTIFDCIAYGGYLTQTDAQQIYQTNVLLKEKLLALAHEFKCDYIHGGSSSEYGVILDRPTEDMALRPHTHYAVAKGAAAGMIHFYGKHRDLRCANLRLYAIYGPGEREDNRLIPQIMRAAARGEYPPLANSKITRDFIHVDDVCSAYVSAAAYLQPPQFGESFNIGTGIPTTLWDLAYLVKDIFDVPGYPVFSDRNDRTYDFPGVWCANPEKADVYLDWKARVTLRDGLMRLKRYHEQN